MHRATQRSLTYLATWVGALSIIIYIGSVKPSRKAFEWTTIRYIASSSNVPETRGVCPGLDTTSKPALVVARVQADGSPSWLDTLKDKYHLCIYTADAAYNPESTELQLPANRGHEAMAYLTFIVDNYASLPQAGAVFVHGSRYAWHNDEPEYDNLASLSALNVHAALELYGYHNMRCDWSAGTCDPTSAPQGSLETSIRAKLEPYNSRVASDAALPPGLQALFGRGKLTSLGRNDAVRAQCCGQFVVSRERIWRHSRDEYLAVRQWLLDGSGGGSASKNAAPRDDRIAGRVLSYVWHILFLDHDEVGEYSSLDAHGGINLQHLNKIACPRADECYCRLYGRCGLLGCNNPGQCPGQYQVPPKYKLPTGWPKQRS